MLMQCLVWNNSILIYLMRDTLRGLSYPYMPHPATFMNSAPSGDEFANTIAGFLPKLEQFSLF
jgi:hypothetical protein